MPEPRIFTYTATDPENTPEHLRAAAAMDQTAPGLHWMVTAPTPEQAEAKLRKFWNEREGPNKTAARAAAKPKAAEPAPPAAAPVVDDFDVL